MNTIKKFTFKRCLFFSLFGLIIMSFSLVNLSAEVNADPGWITAEVNISPKSINLSSKGEWITVTLRLAKKYSLEKVVLTSLMMNDNIAADKAQITGNSLLLKFRRERVISIIRQVGNCSTLPSLITLRVSGELDNGTLFQGNDVIKYDTLNKCTDLDGDCYAQEGGNCGLIDCDDLDSVIHPEAEEICDGIDNDCDGLPSPEEADQDGDGFMICAGDCNDSDPAVHPAVEEVCDGIDNNCDGTIDEGFDQDGDGYTTCGGDCNDGDASINPGTVELCDDIDNNCDGNIDEGFDADNDGYKTCGGDCNDADPSIHPFAVEICDGVDNNCNGIIDDGFDEDGDGYTTCGGDCDDADPYINPGAEDVCDNKDNNCNGYIDEEYDYDGDGYQTCLGDCDDTDPDVHPGKAEICDGKDNNCNGLIDEGFEDLDGDGYPVCGGDCNDADPAINPETAEVCDGIDNNCNGAVDEDYDGDGYGPCDGDCDERNPLSNPGEQEMCDGIDNNCDGNIDEGFDLDGDGHVSCFGDCDDNDPTVHAEATDICGDGVDNDCDGKIDEDGVLEICDGVDNNCDGNIDEGYDVDADGFTTCNGDCNDNDPAIHPNAIEVCDDGIDNNCSGIVDENCYPDNDGDGYNSKQDCNDSDPLVHPGASEIACDQIDQDCNGYDSCRFQDQGNGTVFDTKTGLIWLTDADCIKGGSSQSSKYYSSINNKITSLEDGECGLTDGSWAGDWRMPTASEIMALCDCPANERVCFNDIRNATGSGTWSQGNAFFDVKRGSNDVYWTSTNSIRVPGYKRVFRNMKPSGSRYMCVDLYSSDPTYPNSQWNYYGWPVREPFQDKDGDGYTEAHDDCNDNDPNINPGAPDICGDGIDNDCSGRVDDKCDNDNDGYSFSTGDCDDSNPNVYPSALEDPDNGIDDNCNGCKDCRFEDMKDGTVLDTKTGLRWLKDASAITPSPWATANNICNNLKSGQYGLTDGSKSGDWRLPSIADFVSLIDTRFEDPALSNAKGNAKWKEGDVFLHVDDRAWECLTETLGLKILYWTREKETWHCCDCGAMSIDLSHCGRKKATDFPLPLWGDLFLWDFSDGYRVFDLKDGEYRRRFCVFYLFGCWYRDWYYFQACEYNKSKVWPVRRDKEWSCKFIDPSYCD